MLNISSSERKLANNVWKRSTCPSALPSWSAVSLEPWWRMVVMVVDCWLSTGPAVWNVWNRSSSLSWALSAGVLNTKFYLETVPDRVISNVLATRYTFTTTRITSLNVTLIQYRFIKLENIPTGVSIIILLLPPIRLEARGTRSF